jgi:hypothetical protein
VNQSRGEEGGDPSATTTATIGWYLPSTIGKVTTGKTPPTTEKMVDLMVGDNNLCVETRNRGIGEGILGIPPRPPEFGASHSAPTTPNFHTDLVFGKYLSSQESVQPVST